MAYPGIYQDGQRRRQPLFGQAQGQMQQQRPDIDQEVGLLQEGVDQLKYMAREIGEEARQQGAVIDALEATLEKARGALRQGMRGLNRVFAQSQSNHMIYLLLFALAMFTLVLFFSRIIGIVRFFVCIPSVVFGYCHKH